MFLLLLACLIPSGEHADVIAGLVVPDGCALQLWYLDADEDDYGDEAQSVEACEAPEHYVPRYGDCDDLDPLWNLEGTDVCGEDRDCSGELTNEDVDGDGDTFGDEEHCLCEGVEGYVTQAGDCDDGAGDVFPGATEVWYDDVDQDCGGDSDHDADADGHDREEAGGGDCDDAEGAISPDATEVCNDGIDNNCDDLPDPCVRETGTLTDQDLDAEILGEGNGDRFGMSVVGVPDMNGDGNDEVLVGAPWEHGATGAVYLFQDPTNQLWSDADAKFEGDDATDRLGLGLAALDFDDDGVGDLAMAGYRENSSSSTGWTIKAYSGTDLNVVAWRFTLDRAGTYGDATTRTDDSESAPRSRVGGPFCSARAPWSSCAGNGGEAPSRRHHR